MPEGELARPSAAERKRWRDARAFEANAQQVLVPERVPFTMWLMLETLQELLDETHDAVSQNALAERAGIRRQIVSYWLIVMSEDDLVDRGPHPNGRAWRVILTELGERTLVACNARLAAAGLVR